MFAFFGFEGRTLASALEEGGWVTFWQSAEKEQGRIFVLDLVNEKKNQSAWFL